MISQDDLVEFIHETLKDSPGNEKNFRKKINEDPAKKGTWGFTLKKPYNKPYTSLPANKIFLSEYDLKQLLGADKILKVSKSAILSPLAEEWLNEKRIKIIREDS